MDAPLHSEPPPPQSLSDETHAEDGGRTLAPRDSQSYAPLTADLTHAVTSEARAVAPEPPPPDPAARYFHHYEVCLREDGTTLFELGRGAMGVSYKARDVNLDVLVAIKVINASLPSHIQARERFRREARAAAQLRHPNVASVFHFGETEGGKCFYAMEFIEGETLSARVQREGPLPVPLVLDIALQVTAALIAADERGVVHRDLKPANIMLAAAQARTRQPLPRSGSATSATSSSSVGQVTVKVIDFGLAKAASTAAAEMQQDDEPLTQAGGVLGTPAYASPEQAEGGEVDARSDIYSLGVVLWYLLTSRVPFAGRSFDEIHDWQLHRSLPVAQLADVQVPDTLTQLLKSMLAPNPSKRPASPTSLYEALQRCRDATYYPQAQRANPAAARPRRKLALAAISLLITLLVAAAGTAAFILSHRPVQPPPTPLPAASSTPDKNIAVLPLEDLSGDTTNSYFADGIQDDLLASLAKIKDIKVISRSSVMAYRSVASRNLREIGQQLGITNVLEGSVRRAADRVLVNVALIDTRNGRQIWAEHYDRTLADSLALQGQLATEIATALRATLSPEEKARVETRSTNNPDAYVLYLRARDYQTRPTSLLQDLETAERLYTQAFALDPNFALAHARLSAALAYTYLNFKPSVEIHDRARAEAETALRLQPDSGEGKLSRALCLYWTEMNYPAALQELQNAAQLIPGSAEIDLYSGAICRRQGRWREALANMRRALGRDPRNGLIAREIMVTDYMIRDWPTAIHDGERAVAIVPDDQLLQTEKCYVDVGARCDLGPLRTVLAAVPSGFDPDGAITLTRWDSALMGRDFDAAERAVSSSALESVITTFGAVLPRSYLQGCISLARGDAAHARPLLEAACAPLETEARNFPLDAFRQAHLGVLYAFLGRKEDALRQGRLAAEILPETRDAYYGPNISGLLALIYARTGENAQAMALIERLLTLPGPLSPVFDGTMTLSNLKMRWQWDPLRADPRFRALLAGPEPKTVYK